MKLLICICYHHVSDDGLNILFKNILNIKTFYDCDYKIVIHTNTEISKSLINDSFPEIETIVCHKLENPFHLTWQHRQYIKNHINEYDVHMYIEDDMIIRYDQLTNYLKNLEYLWPHYVPSFLRYEENNHGEKYGVDTRRINVEKSMIVKLNSTYLNVNKIYCACWILPTCILKDLINSDFTDIQNGYDTREIAASFVNWYLGKSCLLQLEENTLQISDLCLIHHASNKYVNLPPDQTKHGKFKISEILYKI